MKKLSFLLIPMALSTTLFAQTSQSLSFGNEALATATNSAHWSSSAHGDEIASLEVSFNADETMQEESTADQVGPGPKVSKRKNFNRGYTVADAMTYTTAIGVRVGAGESGLTAKHFFTKNAAVEGILTTSWLYRGTRLTALYEVQKHLGQDGFYWYWGVGAHAGVFSDTYWHKGECRNGSYEQGGKLYDCDQQRTAVGVNAIIGVEYHFMEAPFTLSIDLKPSYDVIGKGRHYGDIALSARYAF